MVYHFLVLLTKICDFIRLYRKVILWILFGSSILFPLWYYLSNEIEPPSLYLIYVFLSLFSLFVKAILLHEGSSTDDWRDWENYNEHSIKNKSSYKEYNKETTPWGFNYVNTEKSRNGGLTDKEVADRKKKIRKKLVESK